MGKNWLAAACKNMDDSHRYDVLKVDTKEYILNHSIPINKHNWSKVMKDLGRGVDWDGAQGNLQSILDVFYILNCVLVHLYVETNWFVHFM